MDSVASRLTCESRLIVNLRRHTVLTRSHEQLRTSVCGPEQFVILGTLSAYASIRISTQKSETPIYPLSFPFPFMQFYAQFILGRYFISSAN